MSTSERASDPQGIDSHAVTQALERLRYVDGAIWEDVSAALQEAKVDHCNPELDELDCTLLLDLVQIYRDVGQLVPGAPAGEQLDQQPEVIRWVPAAGGKPPVNVPLLIVPEPGQMVRQWVAGFWTGEKWFSDAGVHIPRVLAYTMVWVPQQLGGE